MQLHVTRRDGTKEPFNADRVNRSIERACRGFHNPISFVTKIATETKLTIYDGIPEDELDKATINAAIQNAKDDFVYDKIASRILLKTVYARSIGDYDKDNRKELKQKHRDGFVTYIKTQVERGFLDEKMGKLYDLEKLADTLDVERDELFLYSGVSTLLNRYSIKGMDGEAIEPPQYTWMRVAMGLSYNEENPTAQAIKFYNHYSTLRFIPGGSTMINAGTPNPALSNCFLIEIQDDMEHIAKSVSDIMMISKGTGGIGASLTKLRASGSPLSSTSGASSGPTPFAKIIDTAIRAIVRGGKKKGACAFYMENWHLDFPDFLHWKHNAGDDYLRMRTANTAAWISDEFMRRVKEGETWYLFDPKETPDLVELYGLEFSRRYQEYTEMADEGKLRAFKKMPAEELWRQMLVALQTTAHPWLTWKDTVNNRALNNNTGTIHMSNLCTEICLPQDKDNIAVCNLASVNLSTHIRRKEVDWMKLEETVRTAVRHLDNLIDINVLPVEEARKSDEENRAIGLGMMGFSDTIEQLGLSYDGKHAWDFTDRIFEFLSYMAIDESAGLAEERGAYPNFAGSLWSRGHVPIDTLAKIEENRGSALTVDKESKHGGLDWDSLRTKVSKGIRNATLMAVAPNANIGLVGGTTPGIDPRFSQVFSRNKISGKYLDVNHNMLKDLKNMGLWEKVRDQIIANHGDISDIPEIPDHIKDIYKTSFTTSPHAFIEVAARAQKWVDQALSRNMYLETRDIGEIMQVYMSAWEKGVKSTYYLHMKPQHSAEQSTIRVNKAEVMGKRGFASLRDIGPAPKEAEVKTKGFAAVAPKDVKEKAVVDVAVEETGVSEMSSSSQSSQAKSVETSVKSEQEVQPVVNKVSETEAKPKVVVASGGDSSNTCPIDPAERAQCDSCQ
jgi:ribonucleoside-diphosphate reductase alpha chain